MHTYTKSRNYPCESFVLGEGWGCSFFEVLDSVSIQGELASNNTGPLISIISINEKSSLAS